MRRDHVASTLIRRHFDAMCLLGVWHIYGDITEYRYIISIFLHIIHFLIEGDEDSLPPTPTHRTLPERYTERDAIAMEAASRAMEEATRKMEEASRAAALAEEGPPRKRLMTEEERFSERIMAHPAMPSAHLKITSRSKYRLTKLYIYIY